MPKYSRPWQHADRKPQAPVSPPGLRPLNDGCVDWRTQGPAAEVLAMPVPAPRKPEPKLEINRQPVRDLHALIEKVGELGVCRQLNIHDKTLYRWRTGRVQIPGRQHLAIKALLGDLPGTAGKWSGWSFWEGKLCSPAGEAFDAGQVLSLGLLRQQLSARDREIHELKVRLAIAENAVERLAPAANEARARA
jgi:hypothetical protein